MGRIFSVGGGVVNSVAVLLFLGCLLSGCIEKVENSLRVDFEFGDS